VRFEADSGSRRLHERGQFAYPSPLAATGSAAPDPAFRPHRFVTRASTNLLQDRNTVRKGISTDADGKRIGVVALVPDAWNAPWMPRHHVLSRLARTWPVAWIEEGTHWRELLRRPAAAVPSTTELAPGLVSYRGGAPHLHRPRVLARAALRSRVRGAARMLKRRHGADRLVLYLWRPAFDAAVGARPWDLVCYHVDDEYTFSSDDLPVPEREARLLQRADQVFIHSPGLLEKKGDFNPHTEWVPNGVDFEAFSRQVPEPADLEGIPEPRIGYTGMLKRQLDWPLLADLAERHEEWSFVLVGARSPHPELMSVWARMERLPNVHFLGAKTVLELAAYPQHFDVCIMPYQRDGYTRYIYPMKLHEYLATGRPVVGTPIRTLQDFEGVVGLAEGVDAWSDRLTDAVTGDRDAEAARRRRDVARKHDWDRLAGRIADTIERRLAEMGPTGRATADR
jgi:glycosyltransferase involved in cell wall biosynthesis